MGRVMFPKTGRGLTTNPKVNLVQVQEKGEEKGEEKRRREKEKRKREEKRRREKEKRMANKITTVTAVHGFSLYSNYIIPMSVHLFI